MQRVMMIVLHLGALVLVATAAVALATWRGRLWPLDLRFSALMAAGGMAQLLRAWGWLWLLPVAAAAALPRLRWRLALWPLMLAGAIGLHAVQGPARGFMPLPALGAAGAMALYALPLAIALLLGSLLREAIRPRKPIRNQCRRMP
ncbi:hypothetical protein [Paracoccus sp. (in: a-proteobacteria)]|uniref:hypothetical protein n=1 Tax=Paracoccus sp. TaxID=267 RepID=UPI00322059A8